MQSAIARLIDRLLAFATREHGLIGLSVWRVSTGSCVIYWYLAHYANRRYLWGPEAVFPFGEFVETNRLSLYILSASPAYFELVFHAGIVAAAMFTVGWRTRLTAPLSLLLQYSLYRRNHLFPNGGDNLTVIVQFLLLFANTSAYFAIDASARTRLTVSWQESLRSRIAAAVHNTACIAAVLQLCTVYMFAGLHKASGQMWNSGTALYYILAVSEYSYPPYTQWFGRNAYLVVFFTYATVVFQLGFTFVLCRRETRVLWLLAGLAFHGGIAVAMGLWTFSWFIVSVYALLITDSEYRSAAAAVERWREQWRLTVYYDGECRACVTSARLWRALDTCGLLDLRSFRDWHPAAVLPAPLEALERRIHVRESQTGRVYTGFTAIVQIAKRVVVLWPVVPLLTTMELAGFGAPAYEWFAARRFGLGRLQECRGPDCRRDAS